MKPRRFNVHLSEEQQLIVGIVLVILLAISLLYCLGFASIVLRQTLENAPVPWQETGPAEEGLDQALTPFIEPTAAAPTPY